MYSSFSSRRFNDCYWWLMSQSSKPFILQIHLLFPNRNTSFIVISLCNPSAILPHHSGGYRDGDTFPSRLRKLVCLNTFGCRHDESSWMRVEGQTSVLSWRTLREGGRGLLSPHGSPSLPRAHSLFLLFQFWPSSNFLSAEGPQLFSSPPRRICLSYHDQTRLNPPVWI